MRPPQQPTRNEMAFTLHVVMFAFTILPALGLSPLPGSLAQQSDPFGRGACVVIILGSLFGVIAFFWRDRDDALTWEQLGLAFAGVGCLFYAAALLSSGPFANTALAAGAVTALAAAMAVRWGRLERWIRLRKRQEREEQRSQEVP